MIFALIPAAGKSTRMGQPKLALPIGGKPVLERVIRALREAAVDRILVVLGPHVPALIPIAEGAGALALPLALQTADMRGTVDLGLQWLEERFQPGSSDSWLLAPGDHPTLDSQVVRQLISAGQSDTRHSIHVPVYQGRRGHPALLRWAHVARIREFPRDLGLNEYLRRHISETNEIPAESAEVLRDLDTFADYESLRRAYGE